jgi:broad specificity phosphatase PhoE
MSRRILIRHAQSDYNLGASEALDSDITERGYYQVEEMTLHLKELLEGEFESEPVFSGFVSPYLRCLKTAQVLKRRFDSFGRKIDFVVDDRIGETPTDHKVLNFEIMANKHDKFPEYDWQRYPAEGISMFDRSMDDYWTGLQSFCRDLSENALIISHLVTIKDIVGILTGKERFNTREMSISNCSITWVEDNRLIYMGKR